jgi:hypothetical protein
VLILFFIYLIFFLSKSKSNMGVDTTEEGGNMVLVSSTSEALPPGMAYGEAPEDLPFQEWMEKIRKKRKGDVAEGEGQEEGEKEAKPVDEFFTNWYEKAPVKVAYLQGKGRSLVAKVDLEPGDTVMRCFPFTWAADEKFGSIICRYCLAEKVSPKKTILSIFDGRLLGLV